MKRFTALLAALAFAPAAQAADLGGNCCADLEERVAELEATTARKGNRKVSLTVYGSVNKALLYVEQGDWDDKSVIENGASSSRFGLKGEAKISEGFSAGYVIEVGVGGFDIIDGNDNDLGVRHNFVYLSTPVGKLSLGQTSQATDGIVEITTANTDAAINTLNVKPLLGVSPWDGDRANVVRYDTPTVAGVIARASGSRDASLQGLPSFLTQGEAWDVALRYAGEFSGFKIAAGAGYKVQELELIGLDYKVLSGSASVKHAPSGIFGTVAGGKGEIELGPVTVELTGYHVVGGFERNILGPGATTVYGEFLSGNIDVDPFLEADASMFGVGLVQAVDAAALDLYISYRTSDDLDVAYGLAGARLKF
jgi:hypothetical protein